MSLFYRTIKKSPVGPIRLASDGKSVVSIDFSKSGRSFPKVEESNLPVLRQAEVELTEYFQGQRKEFDFAMNPAFGTPFQKKVWKTCAQIPFGKTLSYGELARKMGKPLSARAVGSALGKNPLPMVVPCHRILASDKRLGGFSGGLHNKVRLLELENISFLNK